MFIEEHELTTGPVETAEGHTPAKWVAWDGYLNHEGYGDTLLSAVENYRVKMLREEK